LHSSKGVLIHAVPHIAGGVPPIADLDSFDVRFEVFPQNRDRWNRRGTLVRDLGY